MYDNPSFILHPCQAPGIPPQNRTNQHPQATHTWRMTFWHAPLSPHETSHACMRARRQRLGPRGRRIPGTSWTVSTPNFGTTFSPLPGPCTVHSSLEPKAHQEPMGVQRLAWGGQAGVAVGAPTRTFAAVVLGESRCWHGALVQGLGLGCGWRLSCSCPEWSEGASHSAACQSAGARGAPCGVLNRVNYYRAVMIIGACLLQLS
jgi:hypothetical protein